MIVVKAAASRCSPIKQSVSSYRIHSALNFDSLPGGRARELFCAHPPACYGLVLLAGFCSQLSHHLVASLSAQGRVFFAGLARLGWGLVRLTGAVAALCAAIKAFLISGSSSGSRPRWGGAVAPSPGGAQNQVLLNGKAHWLVKSNLVSRARPVAACSHGSTN